MEKWQIALEKFIDEWRDKPEVIGALVTGSYVSGNATKYSDIDIHIVLAAGIDWRERGNKIIDGFLMEYFANSIDRLKKYQVEDYGQNTYTDARMYATGKIILDKTGVMEQIQTEAKKQMEIPFAKKSDAWVELHKYAIWDQFDGLKDLHSKKSPSFDFVYYNNLSKLYETYAIFLGAEVPNISKLYKFLVDEKYRERYQMNEFTDKKFVELFEKCIKKSSLKTMETLVDYVLEKMGGFDIDGWKVRTPAK